MMCLFFILTFLPRNQRKFINFGILPMTLANESDYDLFREGDDLAIEGLRDAIASKDRVMLKNLTTGDEAELVLRFSQRQREILLSGGTLNYTKNKKG